MNLRIKPIHLIVALLALGITNAQDYKFGKVSMEELQEKVYPGDSSASAAYLLKKRTSYYSYNKSIGLRLITEVHNRIKIYDKDGFDYASEIINLYESGSSDEGVSSVKGYTYTLEDGEIVETKLDKKDIFKTEQSKNLNQVKFTMPNVKEGSVVEYEYKITSPFVQSIDEFVFQHGIPIKKLEAEMRILEYFKFNQRSKGFLAFRPTVREFTDHTIGTKVTELTFDLENIPALKDEIFVSNIANYRAGVKFEIVSLEVPGSVYESYSKTWEDVVKTIYQSSSFGDELKRKNYFEEELDAVLADTSDPYTRMGKVLSFVKQKVKWNSYLGVGSDEGTRKAYKEGVGNSADINLMLISMLNHANVKAYPVLVSTRDHGVPIFPTLQGFNYVVAAAKIEDRYYLLDATNSFTAIDVLPTRALNWFGRIISEDGNSDIIDLMPKEKSMDIVMMNVDLTDDGAITAKFRQQFTNNNAFLFRNLYNGGTEESYLSDLEKENGDVEIDGYELKNNFEFDKPIIQDYEFYKEDAYETIGGKIYFSPLFHFAVQENPFKTEKREFPVDYGFPWEDRHMITINIPEGYKVEHLPEPISMVLPENLGKFTYNISTVQDKISVRVEIEMNTPVFPPQYYQNLKEFYRQVVEKESEKIILAKT